jgi:hypothetical protein
MNYHEITIFELNKRKKVLSVFRDDLEDYFNKVRHNGFSGDLVDSDATLRLRETINKKLNLVHDYLNDVNVATLVDYSPPGTARFTDSLNILFNIFNLPKLNQSHQMVTDLIDQGVGKYEDEKPRAILRTINPLWWIWKAIRRIIRLPFFLIREAGFDSKKVEDSLVGKLIKLTLSAILLVGGGVLPILSFFGYQEKTTAFIKNVFHL